MKLCPQCETGYPDSAVTCPTHGGMLSEIRDLRPGMMIRRTYRIVRKLGQGGMGAVYLAQHELMDASRALKFLSSDLTNDEAFTRRFLREGRVLRQIRHRNVVDCGDLERAEDDTLFFAMEFVDGPDLRGVLQACPLDVAEAIEIARGIAQGLGAAHALGLVHRDIKPENVLMSSDKSGWVPKVADFGIVATAESSTVYKTTRGSLLTPPYAAPEQWRGTKASELDGRTDIYALGGVLFEMLTGQTVFDAENYEGWMFQHLQIPPRAPSSLRPELAQWKGLDDLVLRMLSKDREQRPKDVAEVIRLLDAVHFVGEANRRVTLREDPPPRPQPPVIPMPAPQPAPAPIPGNITRISPGIVVNPAPQPAKKGLKWHWEYLLAVVVLAVFYFSWQRFGQPPAATPADAANATTLPPSPDATPAAQQAFALYKQKQYKQAAPLLEQACNAGSGEACGDLGQLYDSGKGVQHNQQTAEGLYAKGCDASNGDSCSFLGVAYMDGLGVQKDPATAVTYYDKACNNGSSTGCLDLGTSYLQGVSGVPKDLDKARQAYSKACSMGDQMACSSLSQLPGAQ